jgi:hypothetical protein
VEIKSLLDFMEELMTWGHDVLEFVFVEMFLSHMLKMTLLK